MQGSIVIFGGADREQVHFQDLLVYKHQSKQEDGKKNTLFEPVKAEGDVPMPRSGHALVSYGKYVFLFGGIDYPEEAVYSDIYLLDTGTNCSVSFLKYLNVTFLVVRFVGMELYWRVWYRNFSSKFS